MIRYLKAAFRAAPEIPGLGRLPLNVVILAGLAILGFGHPGFWLLGLALETAYLYALTANNRFRMLAQQVEHGGAEAQRMELVNKLAPGRRERLQAIEAKCAQFIQIHRDSQTEDFLLERNVEALRKIAWIYLKLLVVQQNVLAVDLKTSKAALRQRLQAISHELSASSLSATLRESKEATQRILEQRLHNLGRREEWLAEIDSDMARIEAQVDLAIENAGIRGKAESVSSNIDLVSRLLDDSVYGEDRASIAELERSYAPESRRSTETES